MLVASRCVPVVYHGVGVKMEPVTVDKVISSERGKDLLVINGYNFRFQKILADSMERWCCTDNKCKCYIKCNESREIFGGNVKHSHDADSEASLNRQILNNSVKRKAMEDFSETPRKLIHKQLQSQCVDTLTYKDIRNISRNMHKARSSKLPPLPTDIQGTHEALSAVQVQTSSKEQFLLVNDSEKNIVMFSCKTNLQFLSSIDVLYVDGTFKSAPKYFHQLLTIHGLSNGHYVPIAFFLLANKHQTSYEDVFRYTVSETARLGVNVFPKIVYADFETAIHNAVTKVWPGCEVKGCRFHLGQSWWRKIQSLGLSKEYGKKDSEVSQFLKKIFGLSLLPPAEVGDCFALDFISHLPNNKQVEQFCDYLLENYIDADSTFPPHVWSECSASSFRTINACESFHAHFNALFYSAHPNIFVLVSALQKIQNEIYIKMRSINTRRRKTSATIKKEEFISSKIRQYRANLISRFEYVSCVSYKFLPSTNL